MESSDADDSEELNGDDDAPAEAGFADEDEEIVVPVSYEGIPSWEEAISYLQRRPRDSRPRPEHSGRGRGGNHRR